MKRNVFVSIQNAHTVACEGYHQPYVQTTYEGLTAQRVDKLFAFAAAQDGKVISVTDKAISVEYKDGMIEHCAIGRQYGESEGSTYPHDILPLRKQGEKVEKGDVLAYNSGFYEIDFLDPKKVVLKFHTVAEVAYEESPHTHEDSCAISPVLADKLRTKTTKVKQYIVRFKQNVHNVLKPGVEVSPDDVLMTIADEDIVGNGNFDAESAATLSRYSKQSPTAGYSGTLDKVEVFYHGDVADMSPSLRKLVNASDTELKRAHESLGRPGVTGRTDGDYSSKGRPLMLDEAEVRFFITVTNEMGDGD